MSDQPPLGTVASLGGRLIAALPPAFLLLCLINVAILGTLFWFEAHQGELRAELLAQIIKACMVPRAVP
jgi:hypothetical protein